MPLGFKLNIACKVKNLEKKKKSMFSLTFNTLLCDIDVVS